MEINPYAAEAAKRDKKDMDEDRENDPVEKKRTEDFYKTVTDKQNSNIMLRVNRKGENKPKTDNEKESKKRGPQANPNPTRNRTNKWLDGFEERHMGRTAEMYVIEHSNNMRIVVINIDHPFYQMFYSKLDKKLKFIMAQIISCDEIAKQNVNYYSSYDVQTIIDNFNAYQSSEVSKSLSF
jgi:hypothetical protein